MLIKEQSARYYDKGQGRSLTPIGGIVASCVSRYSIHCISFPRQTQDMVRVHWLKTTAYP
jgi:hypothetical protein